MVFTPRRILILGGTGEAGPFVIQEALDSLPNTHLVLYARSPNKFTQEITSNSSVTIVQGELNDVDALSRAMDGVDTVVSSLGPPNNQLFSYPTNNPLTDGFRVLIEVMQRQGVKRLVALSSPSVEDENDKFSLPFLPIVYGLKFFAKAAHNDIQGVNAVIRAAPKDIEWTLVRVPYLTNSPSKEYLAGYRGDGKIGTAISRAAFAAFAFDEVKTKQWVFKSPIISSI